MTIPLNIASLRSDCSDAKKREALKNIYSSPLYDITWPKSVSVGGEFHLVASRRRFEACRISEYKDELILLGADEYSVILYFGALFQVQTSLGSLSGFPLEQPTKVVFDFLCLAKFHFVGPT